MKVNPEEKMSNWKDGFRGLKRILKSSGMSRMVFIHAVMLFLGLSFSSCLEKNAVDPEKGNLDRIDPDLTYNAAQDSAAWWDTNTIYYFQQGVDTSEEAEPGDLAVWYQTKHLRTGNGTHLLTTDSVWGRAYFDLKRKNITFNVMGFMTKDSISYDSSLNSTTWHYELLDDTLLEYESNTIFGQLTPYKGR